MNIIPMNKLYPLEETIHPQKGLEKLKGKSILLIDNDSISNFVNQKLIENLSGATHIHSFTDPKKALKKLEAWSYAQSGPPPSVIFLDLHMPEMSGWEFLKEFRKLREEIISGCSVVILTTSSHIYDLEKSMKFERVSDYIIKPLTAEKLGKVVLNN